MRIVTAYKYTARLHSYSVLYMRLYNMSDLSCTGTSLYPKSPNITYTIPTSTCWLLPYYP